MRAAISARRRGEGANTTPPTVLAVASAFGPLSGRRFGRLQELAPVAFFGVELESPWYTAGLAWSEAGKGRQQTRWNGCRGRPLIGGWRRPRCQQTTK